MTSDKEAVVGNAVRDTDPGLAPVINSTFVFIGASI